jgi:hypothetical protein
VKAIAGFCLVVALFASKGPAEAAHGGLVVQTDAPSCNAFDLHWRDGVATLERDETGCSHAFGVGVRGFSKDGHLGRALMFSVEDAGDPNTSYFYQFSFPLKGGGTWSAYSTTDGQTLTVVGSGIYGLSAP